jgi:DNA end-binding protein Ku
VAVRSIATLSLSFGLVSIPVKVYSATESSAAVRFKLLSRGGARVRRQYVADEREAPLVGEAPEQAAARQRPPAAQRATSAASSMTDARPVRAAARSPEPEPEREFDDDRGDTDAEGTIPSTARTGVLAPSEIVKGYEFEKGRFVTFTEAELKALAEASRQTIDIVSFIPQGSVDPVYYDKAYYLAPDRLGTKPYSLLRAAMQESGHSALAKWAWRAKEVVVEIRPVAGGLVLQQLLYADEVRTIDALSIDLVEVGAPELQLARRLIAQTADDAYHPERFVDEEKQRILAAVERKIAGRAVVATPAQPMPSAQVIDLVAALRASLDAIAPGRSEGGTAAPAAIGARERKPARRAAKTTSAGDARAAARPRGRQSSR